MKTGILSRDPFTFNTDNRTFENSYKCSKGPPKAVTVAHGGMEYTTCVDREWVLQKMNEVLDSLSHDQVEAVTLIAEMITEMYKDVGSEKKTERKIAEAKASRPPKIAGRI